VQQRRGELVRYDLTSQSFVLYLNGISADHVEFSPDAQWIAYCAYPEQTIWRSRIDGSERLQLSSAPVAAIFPRWSPDGQRIAFMGSLPGKALKIYIVPASGGNPAPLLTDNSPEIDPNWSPDGNSIMFAKLASETQLESGDSLIQIFDLKNRRLSTLPGSRRLTAPRWSPDGRFVAATALSHGRWSKPAVVIFDFKTGKWAGLEDDPIDNKWWSRDGKYFYFDKFINNDPAIYRLRLSDRGVERIAALKDIRRSFNIMGWWMGLTPDGSPMVLRDTSIEEIYALDWNAP
jgi:Tol biopolymer transport system component